MTEPATTTTKPWVGWITGGICVQILGGTVLAATENNGRAGVTIGLAIAWVGAALLLVGLIALGVYLGTRHLAEQLALLPSLAAAPAASSGQEPSPAPRSTAIVAEVRQAIEMRATKTAVRRLINKAAREGRMTDEDRTVIEAMFDEHYPPAT